MQLSSKGERTRERLLDLAYAAFIAKGVAATSVDELVDAAGITKSGFFYHFTDKNDLARQVLARYREQNDCLLAALDARARQLSDDPLHGFLVFLALYAEALTQHIEGTPGCLVATIAFQERSFAHDIRRSNVEMVDDWRAVFRTWLVAINDRYGRSGNVDTERLVDAGWALVFGSFTLAKTTADARVISQQIMLYRDLVKSSFFGAGE